MNWTILITILLSTSAHAAFVPVVDSPVTNDGGSSRGVAWGDYDNDGDPDLAISNTNNQALYLYRNDRAAGFVRINESPFSEMTGNAEGLVWIDYDNDGWLDLFIARTENGNILLRNNAGTFSPVNAGPLTGDREVYSQACWADYDNDGWLDAFLVTRGETADVLYQNRNGETFERIAAPFENDKADGRVCAVADFTGDRLPDIYVGNFIKRIDGRSFKAENSMYFNRGGLKFEQVKTGHAANTPSLTYGIVVSDFDQDDDLDFFVTNISLSDTNTLYENLGDAKYYPREDLALSVNSFGPSKGAAAGDFNCDGALDFFVAEGTEGITPNELERGYDANNRLFFRAGDDYQVLTEGPIVEDVTISAGTAMADMDLDGDLDIVVANWGGDSEDNSLYSNERACPTAIAIKLEGRKSNRMGLGASVSLDYEHDGESKHIRRYLWPQTGYASANEPLLHVVPEAGASSIVVNIEWPSGTVDRIENVATGRRYRLIEGSNQLETLDQ